jgi:hypothetical protein
LNIYCSSMILPHTLLPRLRCVAMHIHEPVWLTQFVNACRRGFRIF